ncbi:MAG TPA: hypothetical protein VJ932_09790 [Alkalispirochaeta sp.]|nr:hypothetical protein [Alkalispirochaeta sp.]
MNLARRMLLVSLIALGWIPSQIHTLQAQSAEAGWAGSVGVLAGANPSAVGLRSSIFYTAPLYQERSGILFDPARVEIGPDVSVNPSFSNLGLRLYVEPIAFADVTIRTGLRSFYDSLGFGLVELEGYGDSLPSVVGGETDGRSATGWYLSIAPRLKAAAGPVLVTNTFAATFSDLSGSNVEFYEEPFTVSAVAARDWVFENTTNLLYQFQAQKYPFLALGLEYYLAWVPADGAAQDIGQRVSTVGVATRQISETLSLNIAGVIGVYPSETPFSIDQPYAIVVVDAVVSW